MTRGLRSTAVWGIETGAPAHLVETTVEVAAVLLLLFAFAYQPPGAVYGVEAERLNESSYFEREVQPRSDLPEDHRAGVRAAIETGRGSIEAATSSEVKHVVRYEGSVYRTYATSVADPRPRPPWGFGASVLGWGLLVGLGSVRVARRRRR